MKQVIVLCVVLLLGGVETRARAPVQLGIGTARVTVPASVVFNVANVNVETLAPSAVRVSFDSAIVSSSSQALRISVRADGDLTMSGSAAIPASNMSWTTSNVTNGVGFNGVLSKTVYTAVYQGNAGATAGRVDLMWRLAAPGGGIHAGTRQAVLRWRFELVSP